MEVSEEEKKAASDDDRYFIRRGMVFPYMKELARLVSVPEDIMDKTILNTGAIKTDSHGSKCVFFPRKSILQEKRCVAFTRAFT